MCGIAGIVGFRDDSLVEKMTDILAHRGPDDRGFHFEDHVSLGHRRLAIIDLKTGHQPMSNEDGSIWITYNGEIYNYLELRETLSSHGHIFKSSSDTEVIIHAYEQYGADCVKHFNGEFAFAIWDSNKKRIILARDRLGIRHLYYTNDGERLLFSSEIKSLLLYPNFKKEIDWKAIDYYLTFRFIPHEMCIFKNIKKLPPATVLIYENKGFSQYSYWHLPYPENSTKSDNQYYEEFYNLLDDAVQIRLRSDVPIGAYLSGGIDSSAISYLASKNLKNPLDTFLMTFNSDIDETTESNRVANFIGSNHHTLQIKPSDIELLSKIIWHFDEPIGDPIVIPLYLLAQATKKNVKVVLTGEGADEIMAGYIHYWMLKKLDNYNRTVPSWVTNYLVKPLINAIPHSQLNRFFPYPAALGTKGKQKLLDLLDETGRTETFITIASLFSLEEKKKLYHPDFFQHLQDHDLPKEVEERVSLENSSDFLNRLWRFDSSRWLPDNQMFKQDRAMMAFGLEGRMPFLDHRVVEHAFKIPQSFNLHNSQNKNLLRMSFNGKLPNEIVNRKKQAFYIPVEKCISGINQFMEDQLTSQKFIERGLFNVGYVNKLLKETDNSALLSYKQLMALVILENWFQIYVD